MRPGSGDEPWLPDLCRMPRLVGMLGLAQLTVLVVALVPDGSREWDLRGFVNASGYALWLALSVSGLLCVLRRALSALPMRTGALVAVALSVAVAGLASAIVHGLFSSVGESGELPGLLRFTTGSAAVVALLTALALRYFYVIDRWQAQVGAHARAEADALQARIRPHFLFNSMNMIASLVQRDPEVAERAVLDLSDLFRAALGAGEHSSLGEEIDLSERYLAIEQLRMGERLRIAWRKQDDLPLSLRMPRLVLQPLLENAVLHGISRLPQGGTIEIDIDVGNGALNLQVRNPSLPPGPGSRHGAGHAHRSIGHRLGYMFGPQARMVSGWDDGYYVCKITLPLDKVPQ
ncbi:sensor histidine kinase [Luteimonas sp. SDU82]|uniref:sensor histidine kinase n=1 Tax=Luteimonas sp. SDU82 TaxID=3422592 RepID=UPI003EB7B7C1